MRPLLGIAAILAFSWVISEDRHRVAWRLVFAGVALQMALALLFLKPSLRTRLSFEMAMEQLGGTSRFLGPNEVGLGTRESVPDVARSY